MNIFFDVDGTLIGYHDRDLRVGVRETMQRLKDRGHAIYLWTAQGAAHARTVAEINDLVHLLSGCYEKPPSQEQDRGEAGLKRYRIPVRPDFCIDDDPLWHIPEFGGIAVRHYVEVKIHGIEDHSMANVYTAVLERELETGAGRGTDSS
jgi:hypothetical protein